MSWGIAGTGEAATRFVEDLALLDDANVVAVGSRSSDRAKTFGDRFGIPHRHLSYEALAEDADVDVVYVATLHSQHFDDTIAFLEAGKHVLCEKPFALNEDQARTMINTARQRNLFVMEALWTRFLPAYVLLPELIAEGRIGEPLFVESDFGFRASVDPSHRLLNRALGGGALLDVGSYPIQLASMVLGPPEAITAVGSLGETGVDETIAVILRHADAKMSLSKVSLAVNLLCTAQIFGTESRRIEIPKFMHAARDLLCVTRDQVEHFDVDFEGNGTRFEAKEVQRCVRAGLIESPIVPHVETLLIANVFDSARSQIGLRYEVDDIPAGDSRLHARPSGG